MSTLPTAEDFFKANPIIPEGVQRQACIAFMKTFAKLHVKVALQNAYDCGTFKGWTNSSDENVHKELFVKNIMSRQSIK